MGFGGAGGGESARPGQGAPPALSSHCCCGLPWPAVAYALHGAILTRTPRAVHRTMVRGVLRRSPRRRGPPARCARSTPGAGGGESAQPGQGAAPALVPHCCCGLPRPAGSLALHGATLTRAPRAVHRTMFRGVPRRSLRRRGPPDRRGRSTPGAPHPRPPSRSGCTPCRARRGSRWRGPRPPPAR